MRALFAATTAIAAASYVGFLATTAMTKVIYDLHHLPTGF